MGYCERSLPHRFISRRSDKLLSASLSCTHSLFVYSPMRLLSPQEAPATSIAAKA